MLINICCSGSSGSTFFAQLLNNHPAIACGREMGFFSKPVIYDNFEILQKYWPIIKRVGISSSPFYLERTILRNMNSYNINKKQLDSWVQDSKNILELTSNLKTNINITTGKPLWAEKTPSNIFTASKFLKTFPDSKVIHIVRDPRDVIPSLVKRGHNNISAAMTWLSSISSIQSLRNHRNFLEIKYEDLILHPEDTLRKVSLFLDIEFDIQFYTKTKYRSENLELFSGHKTWSSSPKNLFSKESVYKYKQSKFDYSHLLTLRISEEYSNLMKCKRYSIKDLMDLYGYRYDGSLEKADNSIKKLDAYFYERKNLKNKMIFFSLKRLLAEPNLVPLVTNGISTIQKTQHLNL